MTDLTGFAIGVLAFSIAALVLFALFARRRHLPLRPFLLYAYPVVFAFIVAFHAIRLFVQDLRIGTLLVFVAIFVALLATRSRFLRRRILEAVMRERFGRS